MILPTKRLNSKRSLLGVGATILELLNEPKTISRLWDEINKYKKCDYKYDWFILGLDFLFLMGSINYEKGRIRKIKNDI